MICAASAACSGTEAADVTPAVASGSAVPAPVTRVEEALAKIVATCAEVRGTVEIRRKGQPQWDKAAVGVTLRERDWVRTGQSGFARVRFSSGGFFEMRDGTTVLVDTALAVESGYLVAVAEPGAPPLLVRSKDGSEASLVATGKATQIRLTPNTTGLEIAVTTGGATVTTREGEKAIAAGEARDLAAQRTGDAVKLIAFPRSVSPGIDARFRFTPDGKIALTWKPVPRATRYHVQVARDTEFAALALDADTSATSATFVPDGIGTYAWRVAAIDGAGRQGEFGFVRRLYLEEDEPRDLLVGPPDGIKFGFADRFPKIAFSWQSAGNAKSYRLVIHGGNADKPVASIVTSAQRVEVSTLREGV
jgi:hypothetical protein